MAHFVRVIQIEVELDILALESIIFHYQKYA